jgi:release factor glutamine methyltransferase
MTSSSSVVDRVADLLRNAGVGGAETEARWLLEAASGRTRTEYALAPEFDAATEQKVMEYAQRRAEGEPLQYVTGVAGFRRLNLSVGPGVFVPRPETELVAERAMSRLPQGGTLIDVGTGSGAIALSVSDERPDARVIATERAPEALGWTRKNKEELGLNVEIVEGDLLDGIPSDLKGKVDVIVSNPPYVADLDRHVLPDDVVDHEPHIALFGGREGTDVISRLTSDALEWLRPGGWIVLEMGARQKDFVTETLISAGYSEVRVGVDFADWPRVAEGRRLA